ncbi:TPA: FKBP-type peptidyl-prolyl cis-trans isomerase [Escherichia coli]|nr:FKBP-type peptidyl-prolyl cis-trans isomerase [Proteus sp. (in: enterobacteria)]HDH9217323.1 FKBP-type peptidyl-prolyl cis-trans isomerase [Escherichia coli]
MVMQVHKNSAVLLNFTLKLADGSVAESTQAHGKPALFRLGDESLSPALEAQLIGLAEGDKKTFTLAGEHIFGKYNPDLLQYFMPSDFAESGVPEIGTIMLFTAMNGNEMPGIVQAITEDSVTVDFNHPLASQEVTFDIEVVNVDVQEDATDANIAG